MSKKIITIVIFLILIGVLALGFFFFRNNDTGVTPQENKGGFFGNLFPFGDNNNQVQPRSGAGNNQNGNTLPGGTPIVALQQLTTSPVGGAVATTTRDGGTGALKTVVRYIERATGNVFEIEPSTRGERRLTNTTIPGVQETLWHRNAEQLFIRYLNENGVIKTFLASIQKGDGEEVGILRGVFMDDDIPILIRTQTQDEALALLPFRNATQGIRFTYNGEKGETLFSSPFREWIPQWTDTFLTLTTRASGGVPGFLYAVTDGNKFQKLMGGIDGLTTNIHPNGTVILYSQSKNNSLTLAALDLRTKGFIEQSVGTLPEKCVWSKIEASTAYCGIPKKIPNALYPDSWYQGVVSFSDDIWKINVLEDSLELLAEPIVLARNEVDIINPFLSQDESYLFFTNKKDLTLWGLKLK